MVMSDGADGGVESMKSIISDLQNAFPTEVNKA